MPVVIPFQPAIADYRFGFALNGVPYIFDVHWNGRDQAWRMDLLEVDETPIVVGVKIVLGTYLGRRKQSHPVFKTGALIAIDLEGTGTTAAREATFNDLGTRVVVRYYTDQEIMAGLGFGA